MTRIKRRGLFLGLKGGGFENDPLVGEEENIKTMLHSLPEFVFIQCTSINEAFDYLTSRDISLVLTILCRLNIFRIYTRFLASMNCTCRCQS